MAIKATFSRGSLKASGDKFDNTIIFSLDPDGTTLLVNAGDIPIKGPTATIANASLIEAGGSAGNDTITVDETNGLMPAVSINGGSGNDMLSGGSAADFLSGGAGLDTFTWNPGDGNDVINGGANVFPGVDRLLFNGDETAENIVLSANGQHISLTRDVGNVVLDLNDVELVVLSPGDLPDTIVINDLSGTDIQQVNVDLALTPGSSTVDGDVDSVTVNYGGQDFLSIGLSEDPVFPHQDRVIVGEGLASAVTIKNADATDLLIVHASANDDTISAVNLPAGFLTLTINGGAGNDTITGSRGVDTLLGGNGDDTIRYTLVSSAAGDTIADFKQGGDADVIDLAEIYVGVLSFDGNLAPAVDPGVTAYHVTWYESGGNTVVQADLSGDTVVDFAITLTGIGLGLTPADFIL